MVKSIKIVTPNYNETILHSECAHDWNGHCAAIGVGKCVYPFSHHDITHIAMRIICNEAVFLAKAEVDNSLAHCLSTVNVWEWDIVVKRVLRKQGDDLVPFLLSIYVRSLAQHYLWSLHTLRKSQVSASMLIASRLMTDSLRDILV